MSVQFANAVLPVTPRSFEARILLFPSTAMRSWRSPMLQLEQVPPVKVHS